MVSGIKRSGSKGATNEYNYIVNRERRKKHAWAMPQRILVGDYTGSSQRIPKYYPQEFTESNWDRPESGSATTQTLLLIGGLVAVVAIAAFVFSSQTPAVAKSNVL